MSLFKIMMFTIFSFTSSVLYLPSDSDVPFCSKTSCNVLPALSVLNISEWFVYDTPLAYCNCTTRFNATYGSHFCQCSDNTGFHYNQTVRIYDASVSTSKILFFDTGVAVSNFDNGNYYLFSVLYHFSTVIIFPTTFMVSCLKNNVLGSCSYPYLIYFQ